jgi:hypothetical protein
LKHIFWTFFDKHSSLFVSTVSDEKKKRFLTLTPNQFFSISAWNTFFDTFVIHLELLLLLLLLSIPRQGLSFERALKFRRTGRPTSRLIPIFFFDYLITICFEPGPNVIDTFLVVIYECLRQLSYQLFDAIVSNLKHNFWSFFRS